MQKSIEIHLPTVKFHNLTKIMPSYWLLCHSSYAVAYGYENMFVLHYKCLTKLSIENYNLVDIY